MEKIKNGLKNLISHSQKTTTQKISSFFVVCLLITSCSSDNVLLNEYKTLNNNEWTASDTLVFDINVEQPEKGYDVFFNIRTTTDYNYANLYFFLELVKPDMSVQVDTFQMILAEPNGKWVGKNSGTIVESSFQIAQNVPFPKEGDYQFRLIQAMQDVTLGEISDVGLKIVEANN